MIYLVIIGLSVFLAYLSDHAKGALNVILVIAALFVPCLFAGVRDDTVGTDVITYGISTFQAAEARDLGLFMQSYMTISAPGFNLFSWLMARTGSFELYLGAIQALTICPIFLCARRRNPGCTWIAMAAYMLLLFPVSLNAMKQMIAVSLCLLSYGLIERKRALLFSLYVVAVAVLFHQTAFVFLIAYPIVRLMYGVGEGSHAFFGRAQRLAIAALIFFLFALAFVFGSRLIDLLSPIKESYSYQANASGDRLNYSALVMTVAFVSIYFLNRSKGNTGSGFVREQEILGILCIVGSLAFQLNMIATSLLRFAYYLIAFVPLYASSLLRGKKRAASVVSAFLLIAFLILYFVQVYVINGGNAVYPYTSAILGVK